MRTPAGKECPHFYGDYFRGRNHEECRLLPGTSSEKRWTPSLCRDCPVPEIARANACANMALDARVTSFLLGIKKQVVVTAACSRCVCSVQNPHVGCGQCHQSKLDFVVGE